MANKRIIDIDAEFDGVEFDEAAINRATGNKRAGETRKQQWIGDTERKIQASKVSRKNSKELYGGYKWIVCSPGNDMLAFYDRQNELLGNDNRAYSAIPPSVVFHYRFEHQYPKELFDKSKNYGVNSYLRDQLKHLFVAADKTYWGQVRTTRYDWLINESHKEWVFDNRVEMDSFLKEKFPQQKSFNLKLSIHESTTNKGSRKTSDMFWRGELKGWSIHIVNEEEYVMHTRK
jgi:hypothetical protein